MDEVEDLVEGIFKNDKLLKLRGCARDLVEQDQSLSANGISRVVKGSDNFAYASEDALLCSFWSRIVYGSYQLQRVRSRVVVVVFEKGQQDVYVILALP